MKPKLKVALIVGHTPSMGGAYSEYFGKNEFDFFMDLLAPRSKEFENFTITSHHHMINAYTARQEAMAEMTEYCDLSIELHFDSFHGSAEGCHAFYYAMNIHTSRAAYAYKAAMLEKMGILSRNNKAVKNGDTFNGAGFILKQKCPALLLECFFGDNPEDCKKFDPDKFMEVLEDTINSFINNQHNDNEEN